MCYDNFWGLKHSAAATAVLAAVLVLAILFGVPLLYYSSAFETEKDDELSKENKLKADSMITSFTVVVLTIIYCAAGWGKPFSVTITNENVTAVLVTIFFAFQVLQNGFFLLLDKSGKCDEDE